MGPDDDYPVATAVEHWRRQFVSTAPFWASVPSWAEELRPPVYPPAGVEHF